MVADPIAAIVSYTVSAAVLIFSAVARAGGAVPDIDHRGGLWFAAVGPCPAHPLVTLLLSRVLLRKEDLRPQLIARATAMVCGVMQISSESAGGLFIPLSAARRIVFVAYVA